MSTVLSRMHLGISPDAPLVTLGGDKWMLVLTSAKGTVYRIPPPPGDAIALVEDEVGVDGQHTRLVAVAVRKSPTAASYWLDAKLGSGAGLPELGPHWAADSRRGRFGVCYPNLLPEVGRPALMAAARKQGAEHLAPLVQVFNDLVSAENLSRDKLRMFLCSLLPGLVFVWSSKTENGSQAISTLVERSISQGREVWMLDDDPGSVVVYLP